MANKKTDNPTTQINNYFYGHSQNFPEATEVTNNYTIYGGKDPRPAATAVVLTEQQLQWLRKAEKCGMISMEESPWKSNLSATQLDYLLGRIFCGDTPEWGQSEQAYLWSLGNEKMPSDKLNSLFGKENIGNSRRSRKMKPLPQGHKQIDALFD